MYRTVLTPLRPGQIRDQEINRAINYSDPMVYRPTRGDAPARTGAGVPLVPPGTTVSTVSADVYRDELRYELERDNVLRKSWILAAYSSEVRAEGDWVLFEGHGETVVITRQSGGDLAAFHNVCQHRGVRLTRGETSGCAARRFTCPYHGWVYDTTGSLVGVPERQDFDGALEGVRAPAVAVDEWGGWVWINLLGPGAAPSLLDWIGPDVSKDLGQFRMEDMVLHEKIVWDLEVNYKAVVDGFNEVYHATELHHTPPEFTKKSRETTFHTSGPNSMMFVPRFQHADKLDATGDHHRYSICHYVIFPNTVFNNNPDQIQVFNPIPMGPTTTRFITWELIYGPDDSETAEQYQEYYDGTMARWEELKKVVSEDVWVYKELRATRDSMGYTKNIFGTRECKPTEYHRTMDHCVRGGSPMDRWSDPHLNNSPKPHATEGGTP
jgi:phenylpropionate dioxygenase-like ring-hydroxylating dioxygenase large terminal subunit